MKQQMTVGQALQDPSTVLGRSAKAHSELIRSLAHLTEEEQRAYWAKVVAMREP